MQLVIGNKNYSSWSMRPWVLMKQLGIAFDEKRLSFTLGMGSGGGFGAAMAPFSPAGRVPVLLADDGFAVWDSLAIAETLHEQFPQAGVWPDDARQRARARTLCAEMHAGFGALRTAFPMNIEAQLHTVGERLLAEDAAAGRDLARIDGMWQDALAAGGGPLLFGSRFCAADAFFAPVALRVQTYGLPLSAPSAAYARRVLAEPGPAAWIADALHEHEFIAEDEPYRTSR